MFINRKILRHERGLHFRDGEFVGLLPPGRYFLFDPFGRERVEVVSTRSARLAHKDLDLIVRGGRAGDELRALNLADHDRALVWIDGRLEAILGPGLHAYWTVAADVRVELFDARAGRFEHPELQRVLKFGSAQAQLDILNVEPGRVGLLMEDGRHTATLAPGTHAFWKGAGRRTELAMVELREQALDVAGQDIMTADRVTLRLNAVLVFRVVDPVKTLTTVVDARQALYRNAQLALREVVGAMELDPLLAGKEGAAARMLAELRPAAEAMGIEAIELGVRDVILPGEMKELLNKVTEARKAAEAALITRREETATIRSQANTAKLFEDNPTLMRLRELEVLERVSQKANLTVLLGEGGLTDRVVKLL